MSSNTLNERIIFGLQIKQRRQSLKLSFAELSKSSGLSISYLNEIEKGKKFPKPEKLNALVKALNLKLSDFNNHQLNHTFAAVNELLRSNFLNELPLDFFGIEVTKIAEIITNAPTKVSAFIATMLEISRNHALNKENFYFTALRSYLQLNNNYFPQLEEAVQKFKLENKLPEKEQVPSAKALEQILQNTYGYSMYRAELDEQQTLSGLKSLFIPTTKTLLLSGKLSPLQESFQFGKELGFNVLNLKERANTSSLMEGGSFTEVHNHSQAIYFSVALHIPLEEFVAKLRRFFKLPNWDAQAFDAIRRYYQATPEMFYHRLTNVLPSFFAMKKMFFLRFKEHKQTQTYSIDRELNLGMRHHPSGNAIYEHYCRRWTAISSFGELTEDHSAANPLIRIQRSKYWETANEYLCFTIAWQLPAADYNVSVTFGVHIDEQLSEQIHFLEDPNIQRVIVNKTCEWCSIEDCQERVAKPKQLEAKMQRQRIEDLIEQLSAKYT